MQSHTLLHVMRDHPSQEQVMPGNTWGIFQPNSAHKEIQMVKKNIFKAPALFGIKKFYLDALKVIMTTSHIHIWCKAFSYV